MVKKKYNLSLILKAVFNINIDNLNLSLIYINSEKLINEYVLIKEKVTEEENRELIKRLNYFLNIIKTNKMESNR
jgi:hypothetical protein